MMVDGGQALQGAAGMHVLDGSTCAGAEKAGSTCAGAEGAGWRDGEAGTAESGSADSVYRFISLAYAWSLKPSLVSFNVIVHLC